MFAIIAAAGDGVRLGNIKKQFLKINNEFIIKTCVEKLLSCNILKIVIAAQKKDFNEIKKILHNYEKNIVLVEGGQTRQQSIENAFLKEFKNHEKKDIVLIHDVARPFFSVEKTKELIKVARKTKAAILACPVYDTVKHAENLKINKTLKRENIFLAQTPQSFSIELYQKALKLNENLKRNCTDDCELIEKLNHEVEIVISSRKNFKITTKEDLKQL